MPMFRIKKHDKEVFLGKLWNGFGSFVSSLISPNSQQSPIVTQSATVSPIPPSQINTAAEEVPIGTEEQSPVKQFQPPPPPSDILDVPPSPQHVQPAQDTQLQPPAFGSQQQQNTQAQAQAQAQQQFTTPPPPQHVQSAQFQ